jgi:hypothetical protein
MESVSVFSPKKYRRRKLHISNIVFINPLVSHRRPELMTFSVKQMGGLIFFNCAQRPMSSINKISG